MSPANASRTCGAVAAMRSNEATTVGRSSYTVFASDSAASRVYRTIAGMLRTDSGSATDRSEMMVDTLIRFSADGVKARFVQRSASVLPDTALAAGTDDSRPNKESSMPAGAASIRHCDEDRVAMNAARHSGGR